MSATTAIAVANANTPENESPAPVSTVKIIPVVAKESAPPIESEMDSAALLKP